MKATSFTDLLVVDDDEVDQEFIQRLLPVHYTIREASLGKAALLLVKEHRPDCILLEWHLPDSEGLPLLQWFCSEQLPVIVITARRNPYLITQAMQHGAQDFLLKDELSRIILEQAIVGAIEGASQK